MLFLKKDSSRFIFVDIFKNHMSLLCTHKKAPRNIHNKQNKLVKGGLKVLQLIVQFL